MEQPKDQRQNEPLYRAKIAAGWVVVAFMVGMLYVAVDRPPNHRYVPLIVLTIVVLTAGLVTTMVRRSRRQRLGRY